MSNNLLSGGSLKSIVRTEQRKSTDSRRLDLLRVSKSIRSNRLVCRMPFDYVNAILGKKI